MTQTTSSPRFSVLISSLPIRGIEGGVVTMVRMVANLLERQGNYAVSHIWNTPTYQDSKNRGLWQILKGKFRVEVKEFNFDGHTAFEIGRRLPMIEQLHYIGNVWEWKRIAHQFPILQVVSGSNHAGLAFALDNRKFVCWVATAYDEDKEARKNHWTWLRCLADKCLVSPVQRAIEAYIYRKCSQIIALSNYTADTISRRFGIPREQIIVLPYLIDTEQLYPPAIPSKEKNVLFIGRYTDERKNAAMLIRAFARVLQLIPDARLLLVGDEPNMQLLELVSKIGIKSTVEFKGATPNNQVINYYHRASVFVIPSWQEGLGIVGLEAMACGLPIVSTRCGGPEDFVSDRVTGFLVPLNGDEIMANRLIELLNNSLLRAQMGKQARRDVEERFSYKVLGEIFDKVYRQVYPELFKSDMSESEPFGEVYADQSGK